MEEVDGKKMKMTRADVQGNHISPPIRHHHSTIESSYIGKEQQKNRPTELEKFCMLKHFTEGYETKARSLKPHFRGTACSFRGSDSILYSLNSELKRLNRLLQIVKKSNESTQTALYKTSSK